MMTKRATRLRKDTGFTLVELLTVIAIVAVMATLLFSAVSGARTRSNQVVCRNNLRQAAVAVEMYQDDMGRRPRSFTRLAARPSIIRNPKVFICPADPALKAPAGAQSKSNAFWGNRVNSSQEPMNGRSGVPEEGSWEQEIRETTESIAFSYLHPLAWRRDAWTRLMQGRGNQVGVVACQLHGLRSPVQGHRPFTEFEGQTLRAQRDGAVIPRKIFRTMAAPSGTPTYGTPVRAMADPVEGTLTVLMTDDDYPWEFYTDAVPQTR
jgi:prepilin-type N-terminal cleavage/methylation domain-containing protein